MGCLSEKETPPATIHSEDTQEHSFDDDNGQLIAVIGPPKVGKSSLIYRTLFNIEEPPANRQPEKFAVVTKAIESLDGIITKKSTNWSQADKTMVFIMKEFDHLPDQIIARATRMVILVYDISDSESLNKLVSYELQKRLKQVTLWAPMIKFIVGMKSDLVPDEDQGVQIETVTNWIQEQHKEDKEKNPTTAEWKHVRLSVKSEEGFKDFRKEIVQSVPGQL